MPDSACAKGGPPPEWCVCTERGIADWLRGEADFRGVEDDVDGAIRDLADAIENGDHRG